MAASVGRGDADKSQVIYSSVSLSIGNNLSWRFRTHRSPDHRWKTVSAATMEGRSAKPGAGNLTGAIIISIIRV